MNYDPNCNRCDRLNNYLNSSRQKYPNYFCKPVPAFGAKEVKLFNCWLGSRFTWG